MSYEFEQNSPIWMQIVDKYKTDIISGRLRSGEKLPSVREGAIQMQVNPNTMQKAFLYLEESGLIYTERTNGKFVTDNVNLIERIKLEYAREVTSKYVEQMKNIGFDLYAIAKMVKGDRNGTGKM